MKHVMHTGPGRLTIGFALSLLTTLLAYELVQRYAGSGDLAISQGWLMAGIVALALAQLVIQLRFFLHVGDEAKPRWNTLALVFAAIVVVILVFGSIWIMQNLDYHMQMPTQTDAEIIQDEGFTDHHGSHNP